MAEASPLRRFADEIKRLVEDGRLEDAVDRLKNFLADRDTRLHDTVLLISMRVRQFTRQHAEGTFTEEQARVERTQIARALNSVAEEIPRRIEADQSPLESPPAPLPPPGELLFEKILGINNLRQVSWIAQGVAAARSVCRIITPRGKGSGFLVGPGLLMTNNHVVPDAKTAGESWAEFDYQQGADGQMLLAVRYQLDGTATNFQTSPERKLDYTLVSLLPDPAKPPFERWGTLKLNPDADPVPTEHVTIIQHPNAGLKQIALTANWVVGVKPPFLHYTTDTLPGSSGSPVFNDAWHVIAIHHRGDAAHVSAKGETRYVNEGVLMSAIRPHAGPRWPGAPA